MIEKKKVFVISTVGLIYDGITSVIVSYLHSMNLQDLDVYVAGTIDVKLSIRKQLESIGCKVVDFPNRRNETIKYTLALIKFIRKNHIDIVHAHGNSGTLAIEMGAAWFGGCKKRIAHSHNTKCDQVKADKILRPFFNMLYTDALACGEEAGRWLFGKKRFTVLQNGRDIDLFSFNEKKREEVRKEYNLSDQLAIGNVGGFVEQKNHKFLLEIYKEILKIKPSAKLFMIGDGPLREDIEKKAHNISENIIFTGPTDRVADLLQAMDGMILPSIFEGLPLVAVEWQMNGLPCILSDTITRDCAFMDNIAFISLYEDAEKWATTIIKMVDHEKREKKSFLAKHKAKIAGFDINDSALILQKIYTHD